MRKALKIITGVILLGISAFYLLGVCLVAKDARKDASYSLRSWLQPEYLGCEYAGRRVEIAGNEEQAEEGYVFYRMDFRLENLSSVAYNGDFGYLITVNGADYRDVGRILSVPGYDPTGNTSGIYNKVSPILPGKTQMDLIYYVEVQEGAGELSLMYYPAWSEDKIPLGTVKL